MNHLRLPLVTAFFFFLAGVLGGLRFAWPVLPWVGAALLLLCVAAWLHGTRARDAAWMLLLALLAVGAAFGAGERRRIAADCRAHLADGALLHLRGTLAATLVPVAPGADLPLLPLDAERIETVGLVGDCAGEVRVRLPAQTQPWPAGTQVRVRGVWFPFPPPVVASAWPRPPRFAGMVLADSVAEVLPPRRAAHPLLWLRGRMELRLLRLFPRHFALADALLLGRREMLDPVLRDRFARAGLVHLLAISGAHVGLLAGVLLLLGAVLRVPWRARAGIAIALIAVYLAMIGAPASAVRAGIMIALALAAVWLQRPSAALPLVAVAAWALLLWNPAAVLEPGFQLSFAGALGILLLRRALLDQLPDRWLRHQPMRAVVEGLAVSVAAFAATAPIAAVHFHQAAPISVVANVAAVPLTSLALVGVLVAAVTAPLPPLAHLLADGTALVLDALNAVATWAAAVPHGHFPVPAPNPWAWFAGAVAMLLALEWAVRARPQVRWAAAAMIALSVFLAWPALAGTAGGALEIHVLDVGQGDAVAIRTPAARWVLIDTGPRSERFDAGERRVLPWLRAHGVSELAGLILTHPDADHIGGAPAVLRGMRVQRLIEPGLPVAKPLYLETLQTAEQRGVPWAAARAGRTITIDGVELVLLSPTDEMLDGAAEANQISVVLQLRYRGFAALFPGDVDADVEQRLVERHGAALRSDVLKAAHHGSRTSTSAALLDAVQPRLVIVSAGRRNRYGHPAPQVLDRLSGRGIPVARTDREGTISLRVEPGSAPAWQRIVP